MRQLGYVGDNVLWKLYIVWVNIYCSTASWMQSLSSDRRQKLITWFRV